MKTNGKIAKDTQEWVQMARQDLSKWNSEAHPDDRLSWLDYVGELVGTQTYGYKVVIDSSTDFGFALVRVAPIVRKMEIEFKSNFGMISPNTIDAAFRQIKRIDKKAFQHYEKNWDNYRRVFSLFVTSERTPQELREQLTHFIQRYDYLYFYLTVKN
jgi:hypothetical protein